MKPNTEPYPFADYVRAREGLERALGESENTYLLLTGESGTGKTALVRDLQVAIDRHRHRSLYFSHARALGASGLVRVLARTLRVATGRSHAETVHALAAQLRDEPLPLWLSLDEAHELPEETLTEVRTLAESDLGHQNRLRVLFCGLPPLRERLGGIPPLWRRILVREEIASMIRDELPPFLVHHFGKPTRDRFSDESLAILFERARGIPGLLLPAARTLLRTAPPKGALAPTFVEDALERWELP
jgi:type II secretory pathway predicted ATPase ExeA